MPRRKTAERLRFDMEVGKRIETARKAARLTQPRLAAAVGVTVQQLYWYEVGRNSCSLSTLVKIAAVLGCQIGVLIPTLS